MVAYVEERTLFSFNKIKKYISMILEIHSWVSRHLSNMKMKSNRPNAMLRNATPQIAILVSMQLTMGDFKLNIERLGGAFGVIAMVVYFWYCVSCY